MDQQFQFNLVQIIVMLVLTLIVGIAITSVLVSSRLKQADGAVDYLDQLRLDAEQDKYETVRYIAGLPANSRHWNTAQRAEYQGFSLLCKKWVANSIAATSERAS